MILFNNTLRINMYNMNKIYSRLIIIEMKNININNNYHSVVMYLIRLLINKHKQLGITRKSIKRNQRSKTHQLPRYLQMRMMKARIVMKGLLLKGNSKWISNKKWLRDDRSRKIQSKCMELFSTIIWIRITRIILIKMLLNLWLLMRRLDCMWLHQLIMMRLSWFKWWYCWQGKILIVLCLMQKLIIKLRSNLNIWIILNYRSEKEKSN